MDSGGGGGGAGAVGGAAVRLTSSTGIAGSGGVGAPVDISGTAAYYGGGGGGAGHRNATNANVASGTGGLGGGGSAATGSNVLPEAGIANTGGGGGAARSDTAGFNVGGAGGSGVVIVRYRGDPIATGGAITAGSGASAGYTVHTFADIGESTLEFGPLSSTASTTLSGQISGTGGFTWNAPGILRLTGTNAYTGDTVVSAGTLLVNGDQSAATGLLTVAAGATLGGSGTIGGATVIAGLHAPGNSPGLQTFADGIEYLATGTLAWDLYGNTVAGRGTTYDGIDLTGGALVIDPAATLRLDFGTTALGSTVDWTDAFWDVSRQWTVIDVAGTATWNEVLFGSLLVGDDALGQSLGSIRPDASFQMLASGGDLVVAYVVPVPEPATLALAAAAAGILFLACCRHRSTRG